MEFICTLRKIGVQSFDQKFLTLVNAGVKLFRFNMKTIYREDHMSESIEAILHLLYTYPEIKLIIDIDYPRNTPRIHIINPENSVRVKSGDTLLMLPLSEKKKEDSDLVYYDECEGMKCGDEILVGDGDIKMIVQEKKEGKYFLNVMNSGVLWDGQAMHSGNLLIPCRNFEMNNSIITQLPQNRIEGLALSFVRNAKDILRIKNETSSKFKLFSKIEDQFAVDNIHEICDESDAIYIGRGDLLFFVDIENFWDNIVCCIQAAKKAKKTLIIGTDVMESCTRSAIPSRADLFDVLQILRLEPEYLVLSSKVSFCENSGLCLSYLKRLCKTCL